jgi:hypothetical protein
MGGMTETTSEDKPKTKKKLSKFQKHLLYFTAGVIVAFAATTAIRFAVLKDTAVHYHANFALYINGQQDPFKSFTFYEEIAACDTHELDNPKPRVHLHDQKPHLIHVHAHAVTWGAFFDNLGYTLGDNLIKTDNGVFITGDDGNKLTFLLNGQPVDKLANQVIKSEDVLLINYGKDNDNTLKQRYDGITRDAHVANTTVDPAACSGGQEFNFWNRLKQALGATPVEH